MAEENEKKSKNKFPGYPHYPAGQDIYNNEEKQPYPEEEPSIDPLDVPGGELDDADEMIGEEDEENNYYSLGGDEHNDLEETNEDDVIEDDE